MGSMDVDISEAAVAHGINIRGKLTQLRLYDPIRDLETQVPVRWIKIVTLRPFTFGSIEIYDSIPDTDWRGLR